VNLVEAVALSKVYKRGETLLPVLQELSFSIQAGEFVALMGPSGSGKSTLLNVLGCLDRPSAGRYRIDGADVSALSDDELSEIRSQKLGFVF
jgi:putative ABC transport system ATP-binding protein